MLVDKARQVFESTCDGDLIRTGSPTDRQRRRARRPAVTDEFADDVVDMVETHEDDESIGGADLGPVDRFDRVTRDEGDD
jgi:hypothetical protein